MIKICNVNKNYNSRKIIDNININIDTDTVCAIMGPSGSGKTTLLNVASGLLEPSYGEAIRDNSNISFMFQEHRLLKWKTVYDNIDLVLQNDYEESKRASIILEILEKIELLEFKDYYPDSLSGGMKQRVALARAFAYPSNYLFMDEPFKSVDIEMKYKLINNFRQLFDQMPRTTMLVTHDIHAAIMLGDKICILEGNPATINEIIINKCPKNERSPGSNQFMDLENILYSKLITS